ncbi:hypothetical protein GXM_01952 [Nostoc sphaeroides CCNUC1]|uniref:Uncharacterized protein n=1 Tax=Nostoc sphaeroides CCNUC1 TaxID=2653204 RepID=A0A5P8VVU9_9NOSO|nr:hypothetical protein GXM_01952 [Nostoc sphaeroides CCNUC1]
MWLGFCSLLYGTIFILTLHLLKLSQDMLRKSTNPDIYLKSALQKKFRVVNLTCYAGWIVFMQQV